ncbi:MAG TPA: ABC transporter substrate-binding protein, partial [Treponemataceae bacterium]|nr:ABC transporter substrate-binding protein [Treponemataceae bacterium]
MKKIVMTAVAIIMATGLVFAGGSKDSGKTKIGVSMPTQSLQRWNQDGANMKTQLEAAGYAVDLQYAGDNDIPTQ